MPSYRAPAGTEVQGVNSKGEAVGPMKFEKGTYSTKKDDEVAILDAAAEIEGHPVSFDQKEGE